MNDNASNQSSNNNFQLFVYLLLAANCILLAFNLPDYISDAADLYPNQHTRLLSGNIAGIFLLLGLIFQNRIKIQNDPKGINKTLYILFLTLSAVAIGIQFWLGL